MGETYIGKPLNFGRPGEKIAIALPTGRNLVARAATHVNSYNPATVTVDEDGVTRVFCESSPQLIRQEVGEFYKSSPEEKIKSINTYRVKVLFYLQNGSTYDFYIGGDRVNPIKVYSSQNFPEIYLSNTGVGYGDWVVSVRESDLSILNIFANGQYTWNDSLITHINSQAHYLSHGMWTASFKPAYTKINETSTYEDLGRYLADNGINYYVTEGTRNWNYASTDPSIADVTGSYSERTIAWFDGGNGEFNQQPERDYADSITFEVKSGYFIKSSTYSTEEFQDNFSGSYAPQEPTINSSLSHDIYPKFIYPNIKINHGAISNQTSYTPAGEFSSKLTATYKGIATTTGLVNLKTKEYFYRKSDTITEVNEGIGTTTQVDKAFYGKGSTTLEFNYNSNVDSIKSVDGATLLEGKYYFLPPSSGRNDIYGVGLWSGKNSGSYAETNIYDKPQLKGKIPVWVASIKDGISAQDDIEANIYPLPQNAVAISASYY